MFVPVNPQRFICKAVITSAWLWSLELTLTLSSAQLDSILIAFLFALVEFPDKPNIPSRYRMILRKPDLCHTARTQKHAKGQAFRETVKIGVMLRTLEQMGYVWAKFSDLPGGLPPNQDRPARYAWVQVFRHRGNR